MIFNGKPVFYIIRARSATDGVPINGEDRYTKEGDRLVKIGISVNFRERLKSYVCRGEGGASGNICDVRVLGLIQFDHIQDARDFELYVKRNITGLNRLGSRGSSEWYYLEDSPEHADTVFDSDFEFASGWALGFFEWCEVNYFKCPIEMFFPLDHKKGYDWELAFIDRKRYLQRARDFKDIMIPSYMKEEIVRRCLDGNIPVHLWVQRILKQAILSE